ncbi:MAG: hypothetical protein KDL87_18265, partial [Verrucomicrobiae bacterium]|nr:hypothetical protein [Verrucomicrobiae bacterium]
MMRLSSPYLVLPVVLGCFCPEDSASEDVRMRPELARDALDPALMCLAIYQNRSVHGWDGPFLQVRGRETFDAESGLAAGVYRRIKDGQAEMALCFRGSDDEADWRTNLEQLLFDGVPSQYQEAFNLTQLALIDLKKSAPSGSAPLTLTGHSLGGGLAAFSSLFLGGPTRGVSFGTSPLGSGLQRLLGHGRLASAPGIVTHFFMKDDVVPEVEVRGGAHFGRIANPLLEPPPNWSGVLSDRDKEALLLLSGISSKASPYLSKGGAVTRLMAEAVDRLARHSMENYVAALVSNIGENGTGLELVGEWESTGSFFQISSNTARFILTANGHLVLDDFAEVTIPGLSADGRIFELTDSGEWHFDGQTLHFQVGGIA